MFEVATIAAVHFFAACRYNDLTYLRWQHIRFDSPGTLTVFFPKRKNDQFRAGSSVFLPDDPIIVPNVPSLLRHWRAISRPASDSVVVFPNFSLAAAKAGSAPLKWDSAMSYPTYRGALAAWFGEALGLDVEEFLATYGTKSGRAGGATTASNAGVQLEDIRRQGNWKSDEVLVYLEPGAKKRTNFVSCIAKHPSNLVPPTHKSS